MNHHLKMDQIVIRSKILSTVGIAAACLGPAASEVAFAGPPPDERDVFSQMTLNFTQGGPASADQAAYTLDNTRR
jgi:hypothetical protein